MKEKAIEEYENIDEFESAEANVNDNRDNLDAKIEFDLKDLL